MRTKGFTLVEIMIALMVLSLISVGSLASLHYMMRAKEKQMALVQDAETLSLAYAYLENDLIFMSTQPLAPEKTILMTEDEAITFTRTLQQQSVEQSDFQTLSYFVNETQLERVIVDDDIAYGQTLLRDVKNLQWTWLLEDGSWVDTHQMEPQNKRPLAAEVRFDSPTWGTITWLFQIPH